MQDDYNSIRNGAVWLFLHDVILIVLRLFVFRAGFSAAVITLLIVVMTWFFGLAIGACSALKELGYLD